MATALYVVKQFFPKVTKVKDAHSKLTIEVTPKDVKESKVRNHNDCAMAVACKRLEHADGVIVSINRAYIIKGTTAIRYAVPNSVQREIVSFDRDAGFRPGTYELNPLCKSCQLGEKHTPKETSDRTNSGNLKKRFRHLTDGIRTALGSKQAPSAVRLKG